MKAEIINVKVQCWETLAKPRDFTPIFTKHPAQRATHRNLCNFKGIDSVSAGKEIMSPPSFSGSEKVKASFNLCDNRQQFS